MAFLDGVGRTAMRLVSTLAGLAAGVAAAILVSGCTGSDDPDLDPDAVAVPNDDGTVEEPDLSVQGELAIPIELRPVLHGSPCTDGTAPTTPTTPAMPPEAIEAADLTGEECFVLDRPVLAIEEVVDLRVSIEQGQWVVLMDLTEADGVVVGAVTAEYEGERIALFVDDEVVSAPVIFEPITGGAIQFSGPYDQAAAEELVQTLAGE